MINETLDKLMPYWIMVVALFIYAALEFVDRPRQPWLLLSVAMLASGPVIWKTVTLWPWLKSMRQGRDGEKRIAQYLDNEFRDTLTGKLIRIFHDVPCENFNLDHVIICEKGIYVLETKTLSVPVKGTEELLYKGGDKLYYKDSGEVVPGNPVGQVNAGIQWLRELLRKEYELEGKEYPQLPIRGVLVPADRYIENVNISEYDIWVLNQKAFAKFISKERNRLKAQTVRSCGDLVDAYICRKLNEESKKIL